LWVERFAPSDPYPTQYFIWNKAYAWKPKVGRTQEKGRTWAYVEDPYHGPVIEFGRTNIEGFLKLDLATVAYGRLYWAQYNRQKGFAQWFEAILRWIRRHGHNLRPKAASAVYCLPDAWRLWHERQGLG
jgi:hypothetical protein